MSSQGSELLIFVVDDESVIATTLGLILKASGFYARSFVNPLDALEAAKSGPPNVLITDVVMPQMNGIDLAIQVTQLCPNCKVILFSGQAASGQLHESAKARGYEFPLLAKPVPPQELLASIKELIAE